MNAGCRFDWYECTFDVPTTTGVEFVEGQVASKLAQLLRARAVRAKGRNGYANAYSIVRGDDEIVRVDGRSARAGEVHLTVSGVSCDELVPIIREHWPEHRVSRADVSSDFSADFEVLDAIAVDFAQERSVSYRLVTDSAGGATRYLGSKTSEATVRVYKKSEQLRALDPARAHTVPDRIVRVEMQMRPGKRATKEAAATMTPEAYWGFSRWTQQFAEQLLFVEADRVSTHHRRPSDWSRLLRTLERQYAPTIQRRADEVGREQTIAELLQAFGLADPDDTPF